MPTGAIAVGDLRAAVALLFDEIEHSFGPVVELGRDHYWLLELDEAHGDGGAPVVSSRGSVVDDIESVHELLARDRAEGVYLWHDLSHLIGVLSRIASLDRRRFAD